MCREIGMRVPYPIGTAEFGLNVALQYKNTNEIIDLGLNISLIANSFQKDAAVH